MYKRKSMTREERRARNRTILEGIVFMFILFVVAPMCGC